MLLFMCLRFVAAVLLTFFRLSFHFDNVQEMMESHPNSTFGLVI